MREGHGGNLRELAVRSGRTVENLLDFSANINPLGPPEWLRSVISSNVESVVHYPDPGSQSLVDSIARRHGVRPDEVIVSNGTSELISLLPRALDASEALVSVPAYIEYAKAARLCGLDVEEIALCESDGFLLDFGRIESHLPGPSLVFLGQPNNPTGQLFDASELRRLAPKYPDTTFVVDEAFIDFVEGCETLIRQRPPNVLVLRSMTKFYAVPGLRLGYAVGEPPLADRLRGLLPPWSVNVLAQAVGVAALEDEDYARRTRQLVSTERKRLSDELSGLPGLKVYGGTANFLLASSNGPGKGAAQLARQLLENGIAIRVCDNFSGLDGRFFRIAVRTGPENDRLLSALTSALGSPQVPTSVRKRSRALMFQGTGSNAGKSVMTAALCRILLQDGHRVAPFKAQNMSLNSFVTRDGGEMGRAQVVQAQACRLDPEVRMNPILLKPNTDTGAQVIVMGQPVGNMNVDEYARYKPEALKAVQEAYDSLADEFDVIMLEGAGSPGEVNLKHHDIVNMQMAQHAGAPVLLVGDIDRGGVFASFVGTMEVLAEWERSLVAGFVVNRFRGDESLLAPAFDYVLNHTGRPVFGVVPYLRDLGLPEEDSVGFKSGAPDRVRPEGEAVEIAIIDLPHISNFTDFDAFRIEPDVCLNVVRSPADLNRPEALILPGSKNVIGDLQYLRQTGLAESIAGLAQDGRTEIVGICAGLQILGETISDPHRIESSAGQTRGLGLLPLTTVLAKQKTLTRTTGKHIESGLPVSGYEIHHGQTGMANCEPAFQSTDGRPIGVAASSRGLWGTYLHGVFDADEFRRWFIDRLRERRGLPALGAPAAAYDLEPALDRLAQVVRKSLDLEGVRRLIFGR